VPRTSERASFIESESAEVAVIEKLQRGFAELELPFPLFRGIIEAARIALSDDFARQWQYLGRDLFISDDAADGTL
jgi:hypothetical protein